MHVIMTTQNKSHYSNGHISIFDWFYIVCSGLISLTIFLNASDSFSYDYVHYIRYFTELQKIEFQGLLAIASEFFPYIFISPGGLFEIGFGFTSWVLMLVLGDAVSVYALIGALSISIRIWVLRSIGANWAWILLLNIYTITLFEANAIRLGCAYTLILIGFRIIFINERIMIALLLFLTAIFFHLQTALFATIFFIIYFGYNFFAYSRGRLVIFVSALLFINFFVLEMLGNFGISKLGDYVQKNSTATGVTLISILGILVLATAISNFLIIRKKIYDVHSADMIMRIWIGTIVASIPALSMLLFATNTGALGDRLWQLSFAIISSLFFAGRLKNSQSRWSGVYLICLMAVSVVNVVYRYPLSNFFYPILPYSQIDAEFF